MRKSLTWLSRLLLPLALASGTAYAAPYPFPVGTQMPGVSPGAYANVCARADKITSLVTAATPGATEKGKACLNVFIKFELIRVATLLEGIQSRGVIQMIWDGTSAAGDRLSGAHESRFTPRRTAPWYNLDAQNATASTTSKLEGSTTKLIKYMDEHCKGDGGSDDGPGGPGVLIERFSEFKGKNFMWERDEKFGPPILPEYDPGAPGEDESPEESKAGLEPGFFKKLAASLRAAKATRNYPGGALDETVEHAIKGQLTSVDVERLHILAGFVGYQLAAPPAGFVRVMPGSQVLPTDKQPTPKR